KETHGKPDRKDITSGRQMVGHLREHLAVQIRMHTAGTGQQPHKRLADTAAVRILPTRRNLANAERPEGTVFYAGDAAGSLSPCQVVVRCDQLLEELSDIGFGETVRRLRIEECLKGFEIPDGVEVDFPWDTAARGHAG